MRPPPGRLVLLGHPVVHSLSPAFQNAALRSARIPLVYETVDTPPDRLQSTLLALVDQDAAGNITLPHKAAAARMCDRRTALAERVGAVNTFWIDDGVLVGDNTDVEGFLALLDSVCGTGTQPRTIALLGAGGGAAAVLAAIGSREPRTVRVYGRDARRVDALCARFRDMARPATTAAEAVAGADLVINATPVGLSSDDHPVDLALVQADAAIIDLVYRVGETSWVRGARRRGHPAADGLVMLLEQGALAFERWFGIVPDRAAMRAAVAR